MAWANCFKNNDRLVHVDISNNNLSWAEMEIIGEGLKSNHTILGLHVKGNMAQVDSQGFIIKILDSVSLANLHTSTRLKEKLEPKNKNRKRKVQTDLSVIENCWLCEGWSHCKFTFTPGVSDDDPNHEDHIPINMQMDCDHYMGDLLLSADSDNKVYVSDRMVPPGDRLYFFSKAGLQICAKDQKKVETGLEEADITSLSKINIKMDVPMQIMEYTD